MSQKIILSLQLRRGHWQRCLTIASVGRDIHRPVDGKNSNVIEKIKIISCGNVVVKTREEREFLPALVSTASLEC